MFIPVELLTYLTSSTDKDSKVITIKSHTPQYTNDVHRTRYYYGKCVECLIIVERAYCIDDAEFMHNCNCGGSADTIKLVRVELI